MKEAPDPGKEQIWRKGGVVRRNINEAQSAGQSQPLWQKGQLGSE